MSGPRRPKFVGPIVSRVTWHGGRGTPYLRRWALLIALRPPHREEETHFLRRREPDLLHRVRHVHGGKEVTLEIDRAVDVRLGEVAGRRIAHEPHEGLRGLDHRGRRRHTRPQPHLSPVPEPEREWPGQPPEHFTEDRRGTGGGRLGG